MKPDVIMDTEKIKTYLPHRDPLLLIENVHEFVPGESILTSKKLTGSEPVFQGHFPNNPIYPGVYQIESLAQSAAVLVLASPKFQSVTNFGLGVLAGVEACKFKRPCMPGDHLYFNITLIKHRLHFIWVQGSVIVKDFVVAEAKLLLGFAKVGETL